MQKNFKTLEEAYKYLYSKTYKVMEDVIIDDVIPAMQEAIQTEVYDKYDRDAEKYYSAQGRYNVERYKRRGLRGGLLDERNYKMTFKANGTTIKVNLRNLTPPYDDAKDKFPYIDVLILGGSGYMWKHSAIATMEPYERDFYEETRKLLKHKMSTILKEAFKRRGIDVNTVR